MATPTQGTPKQDMLMKAMQATPMQATHSQALLIQAKEATPTQTQHTKANTTQALQIQATPRWATPTEAIKKGTIEIKTKSISIVQEIMCGAIVLQQHPWHP